MRQPKIAARKPKVVKLTKGQTVWWCACGLSVNQPFCDGSHQGTGMEPVDNACPHQGGPLARAPSRARRARAGSAAPGTAGISIP
jgi:CDGSH-type Zn-finger protein